MNQDLNVILKIQSLDARTRELEIEVAELPKRIAAIEKQLDTHKRRLEVDKAASVANQKERKRHDDDIKVHNQKISKLRDQMTGAKTNEQYSAFQHEIDFCEKEIRKCEDRIIELMTESEPLEKALNAAQSALAAESKHVEAEKKAARDRTAADQAEMLNIKVERSEAVIQARKDYLSNYERIRKRTGLVVAEAEHGRCKGCNMIIRPQVMQELRQGISDLIFCESCKRILYYNPPVSVEAEA